METMVQTHNLRKTYRRADGTSIEAVKGVDLEIRRGEIFSLLGPNGAGKTTTISMISGLVAPTEGDAVIGGHSITGQPVAAKRLMGLIELFATGGIGGVHRSSTPGTSADVSADLQELARTPVIVVCAGAKALLDLPATLEYLETHGVPVIGYGAEEFPAFYSRGSGLSVDLCCNSPQEVADVWRAKQALGLAGGLLVAAPVPEGEEIPAKEIEPLIEQAVADSEAAGLRSSEVTPYLLKRITELTGDRSLRANLALLRNNARVAAAIAVALDSGG